MKTLLATGLALLLLATHANAQEIDGAFRLALDTDVLGFDSVTLSDGSNSVTTSGTALGLPGPSVGVGLGYGVSSNVLLGARLLASSTHNKVGDIATDMTGLELLSQLEYLFPGQAVRPCVSANLGYKATGVSGSADTSSATFLVGPAVGLHGFVGPALSLDAGVTALFQKGTFKTGAAKFDSSGYSVLLTVAIAGWFGGSPPAPAPVEKPSAVSNQAIPDDAVGPRESTFTLDLPNTAGSIHVTLREGPDKDAGRIQVIVSFLKPPERTTPCGSVAFETAGRRTELVDVRSSSGGGFGSALTTQAGTLPFDALPALADPNQDAWLEVCDQRVLILRAAKRRLERFLHAFPSRAEAKAPTTGEPVQ
jgi:hypothetical protein